MSRTTPRILALGGLWLGGLGACATSHTSWEDAAPPLEPLLGEAYTAADGGPAAEPETTRAHEWWKRYEDPELDRLIESALSGNLDLATAAARVREAEALLGTASAARGPSVDASVRAARTFQRLDSIGTNLGRIYDSSLRAGLTVSWQADLFGRLRATERSRLATLLATEHDQLALAHTLVASVVRLRAAVSVADRRLALADEIIESRRDTLGVVERRYRSGLDTASAVDVHLARENLAAAEAARPPLELARAQSQHALDELLGRKPDAGGAALDRLAALPALAPPPVGLPASLLDRRPDLAAAQLRATAAAADVDVALAARYPDLTLTAASGWDGNRPSDLFLDETLFGNFVAELAAPIFTSGRLKSEVAAARARLEASATEYAALVLAALREVEDAWTAEHWLREQLEGVERQRDEARAAEALARTRYERGLENLLVVLDTARRRGGPRPAAPGERLERAHRPAPGPGRRLVRRSLRSQRLRSRRGRGPPPMKRLTESLSSVFRWVLQPLLVFGILIAGFVAAMGLSSQREAPPRTEGAVYAPLVRTLAVEAGERSVVVESNGTLRARTRVDLVPQVGGEVLSIHPGLRAGGRFEQGDVLFTIDPVDYELGRMQASAEVQAAETALVTLQAEAEAALDEWKDISPDSEAPPLVAREPQIMEARTRVEAARASLRSAELALQRTQFRLPFAGRVVEALVDVGEVVGAGQSVGSAYSLEVFEIAVPLHQDELQWIELPDDRDGAIGSVARVHAAIGGRRVELDGRAVRLEAELDSVSRLARVVVEVRPDQLEPGLAARLLPGLFVDVALEGGVLADVSPVPRGALHEGSVVWIVEEGRLRFASVEIAFAGEREVLVTGLPRRALVVTSQLEVVTDGMQVRTTEASDAPGVDS